MADRRIAVLPTDVADQIAAGEVVERPSSVVKELVENALDAGATSIEITVEDGGRRLLRVSDDGHGMDRDDAVLAVERHATSKIRRASDLVGVPTFGFRGEALPSIGSVSDLEIETAPRDGAGTRVRVSAGVLRDVGDAARRRGTTVTVTRLFHNTPARQKFLRGARSEWRAIGDLLASVGLLRRDVRVHATHDGREMCAFVPAASLRERVAGVWGTATASRMLPVDDVNGPIHVSGLVERPGDVGTGPRRVFVAINGRAIRDGGIVRAAESAYRTTLPAGLRPSLLLEITLPGDLVDVNVHPAKAEVRFRDRWSLERVVESAVRRALGTLGGAPAVGRPWAPATGGGAPIDVEALGLEHRLGAPLWSGERDGAGGVSASAASGTAVASAEPATLEEDVVVVPPLVHLRQSYLAFESDQGIVLIDQHSAHERVLYERFMRTLETGAMPSQQLLFPLTLHLTPSEADAFEASADLFARLGFEVEDFGGPTLIIRSVPLPHPRFDAERCVRDTLAALAGDRAPSAIGRHERLAATVACKAAIKAGDPLAPAEMRALFTDLARTRLPAHDVHGRATIVRIPWDEVERRFGRQ